MSDDSQSSVPPSIATEAAVPSALSYKFQRLREKLRAAIASGELKGKLPGERSLARRFGVNAKTLSKALTDLAAEGVLERSIGRGTFVRGTTPEPASAAAAEKWLLICDPDQLDAPIIKQLLHVNPDAQVITEVENIRPSFLNSFRAVVDLASATPAPFLRDLVVRNMQLVAVGREPRTYSMHAVLMDGDNAVVSIARDLMLAGHHRIAAVEARNSIFVSESLRKAAQRYAPDAEIDRCFPGDVRCLIEHGVSAMVCDSVGAASRVLEQLAAMQIAVPAKVSVAAVGYVGHEYPCSGYYVGWEQTADAILELLRERPQRPTTLWIPGRFMDQGTIAPPAELEAATTGDAMTIGV
ncbi:MAG TPA: GntR family transcriptional regulator [Tepidisphaeraceae bacterium]|nr:GntR family transcriptional regulator [Tepidisphaeraceae bacterium]